jgi:hypothetical protein
MLNRFFGINIAANNLDAAVAKHKIILGAKPHFDPLGDFGFPGKKAQFTP